MERSLFNSKGEAVAYLADDYHATIYLWEGRPAAYLHDEEHVYGINGRHLGWFRDDIIYNNNGERIGFTSNSCPVPVAKEPIRPKKYPMDEIRSKWSAPPSPALSFDFASQDFADFLAEGQVAPLPQEASTEKSSIRLS